MAQDKQTGHFRPILAFYPYGGSKNLSFLKIKKTPGDIMTLHQCTINYVQMRFVCRVMALTDRLFWANFCPFTTLGGLKSKFVKRGKNDMDIMILHQWWWWW